MPQLLQKLFTMLAGAVVTALLLVLVVEGQRIFPLPSALTLAAAYWQGVTPAADATGQALQQARFYLYMLGAQWLLWLVPLAGILVTALLVRRVGDEEVAAYLERLHLQQKQIDDLQDAGKNTGHNWDNAREDFDKLMEKSADVWLVVGRDGRVSRGNRAAMALAKVEQLAGHELESLLPWLRASNLYGGLARALKGETWQGEADIPGDARTRLQGMVWPWGGEVAVWLRDISVLVGDSSQLQNAEVLLRQVVEGGTAPLAVLDGGGLYVYVSPGFAELLGLPAGSLKRGDSHMHKLPDFPPDFARALKKLAAGEGLGNEAEHVTVKGREEILRWHLRPWADAAGRPAGGILSAANVSELHRLRAQTTSEGERENALAYTDLLTGLPNRQLFNDRLNMSLAVAHRQLGKLALMFLDLDGFKKINDTLGHDAGDLLLKQVAQRIREQVRETDTVARLGGDEFTIILNIRDRADAEQVAGKLLKAIREPYDLNGQVGNVGTSIGIALFPADGAQAADLMRKADAAMYEAKQAGKNTHRFATKEIKVEQ